MNRVFVWTDNDLDGAGCFLALKWLFDQGGIIVDYKPLSNGASQVSVFADWFDANYERYDKIFICDISLTEDAIRVVDREKVMVFDHHKSHVDLRNKYEKATTFIAEHSSTCDIIRQKMKLDKKLDEAELAFLTRVNDYDCYNLLYPESIKLNILFKSKRYDKFVTEFGTGLREFTEGEQSIIHLFFKELKHQLDTTDYFQGYIKDYKVVACYVERYSSETAHIVLKKFEADVCMCINLKYGSVSFRKKRGCPIKLNIIAENFCDGGGHEYAAAGKLTERFAELIKSFVHVR